MREKVFVLGLDGMTFDLLDPLIKEGHMPHFRRLLEKSSYGTLKTIFPPLTPTAWTSFMTGKNPGKHGIYDFLYRKKDSYDLAPVNSNRIDGKTLWDLLGEHGMKVGLVNIPMTYPPRPLDGFVVTGLETPRSKPIHQTDYTYPEDLREEIQKEIGEYIIHPKKILKGDNVEEIIDELNQTMEIRFKTVSYLMDSKEWDFFMVVCGSTDKIQHDLMHILDPNHKEHNTVKAQAVRPKILEFFHQLDEKIHALLQRLGEDTLFFMMSDHGNGPIYKWIYLNNLLRKWGYLRLKKDPVSILKTASFDLGITPSNVYRLMTKFGFSKASMGQGARHDLIKRFFLSINNIDWSKTRAYSAGHVGQIFVNLKGREPMGIVSPGREAEALCEEIKQRLLELKDPQTHEPVVEEVYFKEQIYSGKYLDQAADILFMPWRLEYWSLGVSSFISNRIIGPAFGNKGNHKMNGIFLAKGRGIKAGNRVSGAGIIDICPTLLYRMGGEIPSDMDGKVLTDIFEKDYLSKHPVIHGSKDSQTEINETEYSEDEEKSIRERLEGLGYLS